MSEFVYTNDMQDKDATNARSAAYRTVRDGIGLPVDTEGSLSDASKALHSAAGMAARKACLAVEKAAKAKKPRKDWTPAINKGVQGLLLRKGLDAYIGTMEAEGYEVSDTLRKQAEEAYASRLIQRRHETEAAWKTEQELNADGALSDIFGE